MPSVPGVTSFNEWAAEKQKAGLVVLGTTARIDAKGRLIVTVFIDPTNEDGDPVHIEGQQPPHMAPPAPPPPPPVVPPRGGLREILLDLYTRAAAEPGQAKRAFLRGGLRIDLRVQADTTGLQISRADVDPSQQEWQTVINHLPITVPEIEPRLMVAQDRRFMLAAWPTGGKDSAHE